MHVFELNSITARESAVRQRTLRGVVALSVLAAALLIFQVLPVFPREIMVLLAVILGALAYKAATPAVALMLLLALPGYFYQLGGALPAGSALPMPLVAILSTILLILAVVTSEAREPLGVVAGAVSAILMLTPFHYLALPIIIGCILFRTRGIKKRAAGAILTFIALYYPFLAAQSGGFPAGQVPILAPVILDTRPPVPVLSLPEISTDLGRVVDMANTGNARQYLANLADYWPLSLQQRPFPVSFVFLALSAAAIAVEGAMLSLFRWLERREVGRENLPCAAPALSLLVGVLAFVALAAILAPPLDLIYTLSPTFLIGTVLVGGLGSLAEIWLRRRDRIFNMRARLAEQAGAVRSQTDFLADRMRKVKAQCRLMNTGAEESLGQICEQELAFAEQAGTDLALPDLEGKVDLFQELKGKLSAALTESDAKLSQYYDEDRQKYNDYLILARKYGFALGEAVQGPDFSQLNSMDYDRVLELQIALNARYQASARLLAEGIAKLQERLYSEVDPEFKRSGIDIARDYFSQERYSEALQEFFQELGDIEKILLETLGGLEKEVAGVSGGLREIISGILLPTALNLGDVKDANFYKEVIGRIDKLSQPPGEIEVLPALMLAVSRLGELGEVMAGLSSRLGEKMGEQEDSIRDRTPHGFSWGVDQEIIKRMHEISPTFLKTSNPINISKRLSLMKDGLAAIEPAARAVKDYSVAHELLINFSNIEHLVEERISEEGMVGVDDLPVKRRYARDYLKLYCLKHPAQVSLESDTGRLVRICEKTGQ